MSLADTIPYLGPILADAQFRWWLLGMYIAIGPVPEEVTKISKDSTDKETVKETTTRWKWGGLLRILLIGALGHSRLADRVGSLEVAVEQMSGGLKEMLAELRVWRGAGVVGGAARVADAQGRTSSSNINPAAGAVGCADAIVHSRRGVLPSSPQL